MIKLEMTLIPQGIRYCETPLLDIIIATRPDGRQHEYSLRSPSSPILNMSGRIDKTFSGHRNPLHLLQKIFDDITLERLGKNYVTTEWDK